MSLSNFTSLGMMTWPYVCQMHLMEHACLCVFVSTDFDARPSSLRLLTYMWVTTPVETSCCERGNACNSYMRSHLWEINLVWELINFYAYTGISMMDFRIFILTMPKNCEVNMLPSLHPSAPQELSLSSSLSFIYCHGCLLLPSHWSCLSFQLAPLSEWKMKGM